MHAVPSPFPANRGGEERTWARTLSRRHPVAPECAPTKAGTSRGRPADYNIAPTAPPCRHAITFFRHNGEYKTRPAIRRQQDLPCTPRPLTRCARGLPAVDRPTREDDTERRAVGERGVRGDGLRRQ